MNDASDPYRDLQGPAREVASRIVEVNERRERDRAKRAAREASNKYWAERERDERGIDPDSQMDPSPQVSWESGL